MDGDEPEDTDPYEQPEPVARLFEVLLACGGSSAQFSPARAY